MAILESEAIAAPEKEHIPTCWEHPSASYWLLRAAADSRAFTCSEDDLYIAAVFCAAELQVGKFDVPRDLDLSRAKDGSNVQVVSRVRESSGIGCGVEQLVARIWMAPARRDMLLFWSGNSFRLQDRSSLLRVSCVRRDRQAAKLAIL